MSTLLLKHNLDLYNRRILITGEITPDTYEMVIKNLSLLTRHVSPEDLQKDGIEFVLNTEGGDFYSGLAIYDLIKGCQFPTKAVCIGYVMSAGTIILQAADLRTATPNALLMVHYGTEENNSLSDLQNNLEMFKLLKKIYTDRSIVSKYSINKWFKTDTYFTAKKALSVGLIDEILDEK